MKRHASITLGVLALLAWPAVAQTQPVTRLPNASRARLVLLEQRNSPSEPWFTSEVVVRARWGNNDAFSGVRAAMGLDSSRYNLAIHLAHATEDRGLPLLSWVISDGWVKTQEWPGGPVASASVVGDRGSVGFVFGPSGRLRLLRVRLVPEEPIEHWFGYDLWLDFSNPPAFARVTMQRCRLRESTTLSRRWVCPRLW